MDAVDRAIINHLQDGLPLVERPFAAAAAELGIDENALIARLEALLAGGVLTRFGPLIDVAAMGGAYTLAALSVPHERFDEVAAQVNAHPEVAHNYAREHELNMWFVVAAQSRARIDAVLAAIGAETGLPVYDFPKQAEYFVEARFRA